MSPVQAELPHLAVIVAPDGRGLAATLNGKPHSLPDSCPADPWAPARDLATATGMAVFAEVTERGVTYGEILNPTPPAAPDAGARPVMTAQRTGGPFTVAGNGFTPGEDVYIAAVVSTRTARPDGVAELPFPGSLLGRLPGVLIMFGLDSQTLIVADPTAEPRRTP